MKKVSKFFISFLFIILCFLTVHIPVNADSGWDSDYSSGGSSDWGSSSDWSSSHDWSSSSSRDYYSNGSSNSNSDSDNTFFYIFIAVMSLFLCWTVLGIIGNEIQMIKSFFKRNRADKELNDKIYNHAGNWYSENIDKFLPGFTEKQLLDDLYNKFVEIQNAWMEFDYDTLKRLCTDELYESYKSDLEILSVQGGKNIMNDFKLLSSRISKIERVEGRIVFTIFLNVSFHDYVIDVKNNKVIRGNKHMLMNNKYNLVFVIDNSGFNNICPNCGAKLESRDCPYCGSHVDITSKDFVLSKKERIR